MKICIFRYPETQQKTTIPQTAGFATYLWHYALSVVQYKGKQFEHMAKERASHLLPTNTKKKEKKNHIKSLRVLSTAEKNPLPPPALPHANEKEEKKESRLGDS